MKDLGYSMDTGVLPVGRLPHALRRDNRYFGESDMTPKCWTENPTFGGHIMSKISNEIRLEAVQRVVEDGMSISGAWRGGSYKTGQKAEKILENLK